MAIGRVLAIRIAFAGQLRDYPNPSREPIGKLRGAGKARSGNR
jgi:hypothetical protein